MGPLLHVLDLPTRAVVIPFPRAAMARALCPASVEK
jgi:hypothetical protein